MEYVTLSLKVCMLTHPFLQSLYHEDETCSHLGPPQLGLHLHPTVRDQGRGEGGEGEGEEVEEE